MKYLFLVSLGPVQSFIASARRARDLCFGSWLLSELSKAAANKIMAENELKSLIFPAPDPQDKDPLSPGNSLNVANKIVAVIDQSPQTMGEEVRKAIDARLTTIKNWAYTGIEKQDYYEQVAQAQVDHLVEYSWVAVPYDGNNYEEKRKILEALLDARKNTRDFRQVEWGKNTPKSSIDGQLESVIPENKYPGKDAPDEDKAKKIKYLYDKYGAGPAERLSGVDILKRKGSFQSAASGFPSTSHMAAISFLERLKAMNASQKAAIQKKWNEYIKEINDIPGSHIEKVPTKYAAGADAITLHHTYGVPYIPGSALKGLAASYADKRLGDPWKKGRPAYRAVFGDANNAGYISFFDALYIPGSGHKGRVLYPDVITVHHPKYYQEEINVSPSDWDSPNPVPFLSATGKYLIALAAPDLGKDSEWIKKTFEILRLALQEMGIGAKTSSGYGRMELEENFDLDSPDIQAAMRLKEEIDGISKAEVSRRMQSYLPKWRDMPTNEAKKIVARAIVEKIRDAGLEKTMAGVGWYNLLLQSIG